MNYHKQIFRAVDRINLLVSIIEGNVNLQPPGAGININLLLSKGVYLAAFPLQEYDSLKDLQKKWLNVYSGPWNQPIETIKDYFGGIINKK